MERSGILDLVHTLIFDLSEVLIAGLLGIEKPLAEQLSLSEEHIFRAFGGERLQRLCSGELTEYAYLEQILQEQAWTTSIADLKQLIRWNFHTPVPEMDALLTRLAARYDLVLLSDHAAEWVQHIRTIHPFLQSFQRLFFSYELKQTKLSPSTFLKVLEAVGRQPDECLFIDDSPRNVAVAHSIGLPGSVFTSAGDLAHKLVELGILDTEPRQPNTLTPPPYQDRS